MTNSLTKKVLDSYSFYANCKGFSGHKIYHTHKVFFSSKFDILSIYNLWNYTLDTVSLKTEAIKIRLLSRIAEILFLLD